MDKNSGFSLIGNSLEGFTNDVDFSNTVDDKAVYYWVGRTNLTVDATNSPAVACLILVNCTHMIVRDLNLTTSRMAMVFAYTVDSKMEGNTIVDNLYGIYFWSSSNNSVVDNAVTENQDGIVLESSSNNNVSDNNVAANEEIGIVLRDSSSNSIANNTIANSSAGIVLTSYLASSVNNNIYHNVIANNTYQVGGTLYSANFWDDGSKGNYWSDYQTKYPDATPNGEVWDTPYVIDANNTDHYPLVNQPVIPEFPSLLIFPLFMSLTLCAAIAYRKRREKLS